MHSQETKARQRATKLEERLREKEEFVKRTQKKMEQEYARCQKEMEAEVREAKEELARARGDCEARGCHRRGACRLQVRQKRTLNQKPVQESPKHELGKDMWKQLTRVSIPVLSGDKRSYGSWKGAFMACVDKAPATA